MSNNSLIIKYSKCGYKLQAFVDKAGFNDYKQGKKQIRDICLSDTLATEAGEKLSEAAMMEVFATTDVWKCLEDIVTKGEPQYSVQERREMTENKRKQIVEYISKTYIDPKTKLPHPITRIDNGMKTIKGLKIDLNSSVSSQGDEIVKQLKSSMSFLKNETSGFLYIPLESEIKVCLICRHSGKATSVVRKWCEIRRSKYTNTDYKAEVTFATTQMSTFMNELTNVTGGNFKFEDFASIYVLNNQSIDTTASSAETTEEPSKKGGKSKKGKK